MRTFRLHVERQTEALKSQDRAALLVAMNVCLERHSTAAAHGYSTQHTAVSGSSFLCLTLTSNKESSRGGPIMFEWIVVGVIWAAAIVMVAHTIDEAVSCARPLRAQLRRCPDSPTREEEGASRVHRGNDEARKRAA